VTNADLLINEQLNTFQLRKIKSSDDSSEHKFWLPKGLVSCCICV